MSNDRFGANLGVLGNGFSFLGWWNSPVDITLPETNIAPENWWLEDYFPFREAYPMFRGLLLVLGRAAFSFREGKSPLGVYSFTLFFQTSKPIVFQSYRTGTHKRPPDWNEFGIFGRSKDLGFWKGKTGCFHLYWLSFFWFLGVLALFFRDKLGGPVPNCSLKIPQFSWFSHRLSPLWNHMKKQNLDICFDPPKYTKTPNLRRCLDVWG